MDPYELADGLMKRVMELEDTLRWYSEPHGSGICISPCCLDNGRRAKAVLNFKPDFGKSTDSEPNSGYEKY